MIIGSRVNFLEIKNKYGQIFDEIIRKFIEIIWNSHVGITPKPSQKEEKKITSFRSEARVKI